MLSGFLVYLSMKTLPLIHTCCNCWKIVKSYKNVITHIFSFEISHWKSITFRTHGNSLHQKCLVTDYGYC